MCKSKKNEDNYNILNKEITLILIIHNLHELECIHLRENVNNFT